MKKAADTTLASEILSEISTLYQTIRDKTVRFLDGYSIPALHELIAERSGVLERIDAQEHRLRMICEEEEWRRCREFSEIQQAISSITTSDRQIADRVRHDMAGVSRELSSLSATEKAAIGYTRHLRQ